MKKLIMVGALVLSLVSFSGSAFAAGYGDAGCGLGSIVFGSEQGPVQVLAATTNGTFGSQTFGITSGTSNCADSGGGSASAKAFIEANRESLSKDIARGQGETIANLSVLAGCADEAAVGATLQQNFSTIFRRSLVPAGYLGLCFIVADRQSTGQLRIQTLQPVQTGSSWSKSQRRTGKLRCRFGRACFSSGNSIVTGPRTAVEKVVD